MPRFKYVALSADGRNLSGLMEEADEASVRKALESQRLVPISIGEAQPLFKRLGAMGQGRASTKAVLQFTEQLADLLQAGLPLDRALHVLMGTLEDKKMCDIVRNVRIDVERGSGLAASFAKYPGVFPKIYVNMVRAGEEGGILPVTLARLIEYYQRTIEFRSFLITSSIYPALLTVFGLVALAVLALTVIPKFGDIFADMGKELPFAAALLVSVSSALLRYGLFILGAVVATVVGLWLYIRTPSGMNWWHRLLLNIPLLGRILIRTQLARVLRTLGTLLASGVPILASLRIVHGLAELVPMKAALDRLAQAVKEGKGVAQPLKSDAFFPPLVGHLATVGEESGALDKMLLKVADQYDTEVRKATKNFVALFEPLIIAFMGLMIGAVVVSMLSAIFSMTDLPM